MYTVDLYLRVRLACHVDGLSQREAASRFGIARETVRKMLRHSEPPGYRRRQPPKRPKLAPFTDIIDRILEEDRPVHHKQHHTAKRIFERLRDEHGFTGKETIVKDYVRERRLRRREMFVPLSHPPGHAQADFGEADAIIAGVKYRAHFVVMTLPHSDACFVAAYPAATTEAWLDGHNRAFVFFGGVPQSILYDNDKCLVSRILSDGTRQRTRAFSGLQSHYLFEDRYGRPGKGNDKGNVEGVVGYARRNFMTPLPRFASWDAFNGHLEEQCRNRQGNVLRGHRESIGERFVRDREALKRPLPAGPRRACLRGPEQRHGRDAGAECRAGAGEGAGRAEGPRLQTCVAWSNWSASRRRRDDTRRRRPAGDGLEADMAQLERGKPPKVPAPVWLGPITARLTHHPPANPQFLEVPSTISEQAVIGL